MVRIRSGHSLALVICLITFFVVSWILGRQGKQQSENEVTGGRQLTDNPKDVARMLKKDGKDSDIRIGDLPIIRDSEIQNFCLHGTVGAGKSEVIRRLANYARQRGDMVVIYDRSGEFVKSYYDPSIDKILNPLDARCAAWDLWKECLTQPDFDNTANTLIPMGTKEDPFWQGSGRTIFAEAAYLMRNDPNRSYSKLVDTLLSIKIEKLRTFLRNSPAARTGPLLCPSGSGYLPYYQNPAVSDTPSINPRRHSVHPADSGSYRWRDHSNF